jgi:hypothetical protein
MNEKKIENVDLTNLNGENWAIKLTAFSDLLHRAEEPVLLLLDFEGTFLSTAIQKECKNLFREYTDKIESAAFMGVGNGVRKLILQSLQNHVLFSDDKTDCEDWLLGR